MQHEMWRGFKVDVPPLVTVRRLFSQEMTSLHSSRSARRSSEYRQKLNVLRVMNLGQLRFTL